tara:strand:+ start:193 stop:312 length:120 start_codon:yes stop_codon:yes gene_type:complete
MDLNPKWLNTKLMLRQGSSTKFLEELILKLEYKMQQDEA